MPRRAAAGHREEKSRIQSSEKPFALDLSRCSPRRVHTLLYATEYVSLDLHFGRCAPTVIRARLEIYILAIFDQSSLVNVVSGLPTDCFLINFHTTAVLLASPDELAVCGVVALTCANAMVPFVQEA